MEDFVRKLALWHTKTFKPIMTHDELEPIMATLGFVALPATSGWKEYVFYGWIPVPAEKLPRIRLPFPRIDGLHVITYRAFFDAVSFYLAQRDISDHFHVRSFSVSLHLVSVLFLDVTVSGYLALFMVNLRECHWFFFEKEVFGT
eukprot:TRINITY_DN6334_c1_g1_i3.p1 TRINITY_DN6334_c1_g1~~TRINITY_DN6334_c1_g1_i3.p1  ORF type:complete len:145 (+),score=8.44 TRINITY_DN6334_c1_g1_i3:534-968(+)